MAGQLTDLVHANGSEVFAASHYTLDVLGRRTAQTRAEDGVSEKYGYDTTSQRTSVDYGARPAKHESFGYDPMGNRASATYALSPLAANLTPYTTNAINQYSTVGGISFVYDANGNLLNDGKQSYAYDAQNHLIAVEGASTRAEFYYDPRNRCVLRKYYTKGSQSQWVLDQAQSVALTYDSAWNLLTERTLGGSLSGEYVFGLQTDEILSASLVTKAYYPLNDGLGSTVALANGRGIVTERVRYDVYGQPRFLNAMYKTTSTSAAGYRFLFTAREWLALVQLNDHRNRYYSPGLERFITADPIRFGGGPNFYTYAGNNPVCSIDPSGLAACNCITADGKDRTQFTGDPTRDVVWAFLWATKHYPDEMKGLSLNNVTIIPGGSPNNDQLGGSNPVLNTITIYYGQNLYMSQLVGTIVHEGAHIQGGVLSVLPAQHEAIYLK